MKYFDMYQMQIIETIIVLAIIFLIKFVLTKLINRRIKRRNFSLERRVIAAKTVNSILTLVTLASIASVWSVDQSQIWLFISSILTVLGVAFFAQWSHLSNVTSGIIVFFNQSTKIGDKITIMEKDFNISGKIVDIETMFIILQTDEGEIISVPNNIMLQKPIKIENYEPPKL